MRATFRLPTSIVAVVLLAAGLVVPLVPLASPAVADVAPAPGVPATVSADGLPTWQVNGVVWSQAVVGRTVYVTGSFTAARPPNVPVGGAGEVPALNLFAYDIVTGNRVESFNHSLNAQGRVVRASPDGSRIYVGGDFTAVDGRASGKIVAFDTATNTQATEFAPEVSGTVAAIATDGDTVWFGGNFFNVNKQARSRLAAVRASTGANLSWAPVVNDDEVLAMVLAPDSTRVIVGGKFTRIDGRSARGMGSLDATTGELLPWAANQKIKNGSPRSAITSLSTDGVSIFGSGYEFGGGNFEGTFSADPTTGALRIVQDCLGDTYDTFPVNGVLYSVSHAHDCRSARAFPEVNPRRWMQALAWSTTPGTRNNLGPNAYGWNYSDIKTSDLLHWFPKLGIGSYTKQYQAAWSVTGNADYVVMGGEFPSVDGRAQQGLTRMAVAGKATLKRGPVRSGTAAPQATSPSAGRVTVTFPAAFDQDDQRLTYELYRSGTATPVAVTTEASNFWTIPSLSLSDAGLGGGSYTYTVRAVDSAGNSVALGTSGAVTVAGAPNASPTAAFTATPSGRTVAFSSQSTDPDGSLASQSWDFGDNSPAGAGVTPSHTYAAPGAYQVRLTVTDDKGAVATTTRSVVITNAAPVAAYTSTQDLLEASFDASGSADPDGTVASYSWVWGDGTAVGSGRQATHAYASAGTYPVTLTVTDVDGATASITREVTVAANQAPVARFTATVTQLAVAVDATRSSDADGSMTAYSWSWGDGSPDGSGATASHTYAAAGSYPVTLTVTDDRGEAATTTSNVAVASGAPILARDTFARTTANSWGSADVGGAWAVRGNVANFSVAGGVGTIRLPNAGAGPSTFLGGVSSARTNTSVIVSNRVAPTGGGIFTTVVGRELPAGGGYRAALNFRSDRSVTVGLLRRSPAGLDSFLVPYTVVSGLSVNPGDQVNVRFLVDGTGTTVLRARVWAVGTPEPLAWSVSTTDSTPELQAPGTVGMATFLSGSATNAPAYVDVRSFSTAAAD